MKVYLVCEWGYEGIEGILDVYRSEKAAKDMVARLNAKHSTTTWRCKDFDYDEFDLIQGQGP